MSASLKFLLPLTLLLILSFQAVLADDEDYEPILTDAYDYQQLGGVYGRLKPHENNLMGDAIDLKTGALTLMHTDIVLPGTGPEVALRRKYVQGGKWYSAFQQAFGEWELDIPIAHWAHGSTTNKPDFNDGCMLNTGSAGSGKFASNDVYVTAGVLKTGLILHVPGAQLSGFPNSPMAGIKDPKNNWISASRENDYAGNCSEVTIAPDGTKYKFGKHEFRKAKHSDIPALTPEWRSTYGNQIYQWGVVSREYTVLLITEVVDVHGNWVRYEYNSNNELKRIKSSDGRQIDLYYSSVTPISSRNSHRVEYITAHGKTWDYKYSTGGKLVQVELPDGREWDFGSDSTDYTLRAMDYELFLHWDCVPIDRSFSIKHPDGVVGTFVLSERRHTKQGVDLNGAIGANNIPGTWGGAPSETDLSICQTGYKSVGDEPPEHLVYFRANSLIEKTLSASDIENATWKYEYKGYSGGAIDTTWTKVTSPDDTVKKYTWQGIGPDHGLLKQIDIISGTSTLETQYFSYDLSQKKPNNCVAGGVEIDEAGMCLVYAKRPETKSQQVRGGVT